jgi:arginine-tRNA-protein transferase
MYPPSEGQFSEFINNKREETQFLEFRQSGTLIGCAVTDVLSHSLSAIYTYFDPLSCARSLGKFAILYQIDLAQRKGLDHVYLGYWIKESQKMNYKADYRPMETFDKNMWNLVE